MTENQWPQDGGYGTPTVTQGSEPELRQSSTFPPAAAGTATTGAAAPGTASKTDTAKDEAAEVTRQAADAAQNVTETAKAEAAHVAGEVKSNAKDLLTQARTDLTAQAGAQQQKAAQGLRSISSELHTMAAASGQPGVATDLVRQAAERSSSVAAWLDNRDPGSLLNEVKSFARQRPGTFLLAAAGAGILAGRLSRSLSAGAPETTPTAHSTGTAPQPGTPVTRVPDAGVAVPPPPVGYPETTTAGMAGTYPEPTADGTYQEPAASDADTYPPSPLEGSGTRNDPWADDPLAADPYRIDPALDPDRKDPFDGGRR
ncbi:hypothetical protein E7Y32_04090 [Arthrobacter sp. UKPF54-2]|uniref:hypothetical protein n=1 Tax=Arthrobacter sp. UKPF54-2 TaxID=2600159 RepID=UPI0011B10546|nr:hypothetical protein [Arthrobacter sp. UKPF54-2]QDY89479.1 hypothetical protein E7Y32_04090 [Arthrobacter sp. UKPF54-2]